MIFESGKLIKESQAHLNLEVDGVHSGYVECYDRDTANFFFNQDIWDAELREAEFIERQTRHLEAFVDIPELLVRVR